MLNFLKFLAREYEDRVRLANSSSQHESNELVHKKKRILFSHTSVLTYQCTRTCILIGLVFYFVS